MDWNSAIEKNREALKRILGMLVAMLGAPNGGSAGGQFTFFPQKGGEASGQAQAEKSKLSPAPTLPRHLHRFVLRLLRPAEAAARRLIIVAARGLVVELAPQRRYKPKPRSIFVRNGIGTGIVRRPGSMPERATAPRALSLPLFDPLKRFGGRRKYVKPGAVPRIRSFDDPRIGLFQPPRAPDPLPPSPDDPLDARRLHLRLEAMGRVLDDLPRHAKRLARWQARVGVRERERRDDLLHPTPALRADLPGRATGLARPPDPHQGEGKYGAAGAQTKPPNQRCSPLRPGRPPGWRRRPDHEVYGVLNELHGLAVWARERRDTS